MNPADFRAAATEMEKNGTYQESEEQAKLKASDRGGAWLGPVS